MDKSGGKVGICPLEGHASGFPDAPLSIEDNDVGIARTVWGREDCY